MKKTTIRFLPVLVILSLILSIVPNYGQHMLVEARVNNPLNLRISVHFHLP